MATLGGIKETQGSQNSVEIDGLARFAVDEHNKKQNTLLEFVRVVAAKEQLVAGTMYYLTIEAIEAGKKKLYEAKVWVKLWENFKELQEFKYTGDVEMACGGITEIKGFQNSIEIDGLARFAVDEHNKKQNTLLEFVRVVAAKEQVVAGTMYYLTIEAIEAGKKKLYEAKVWVKLWENFKELQEFTYIGDVDAFTSSDLGVKKGP